MRPRQAVFLDRDGVINELVADPASGLPEGPLRPEDVLLVPGAARSLRRLTELGVPLVCVTNQPGAAKGMTSIEALQATHARVRDLLAAEEVELDFRICYHHPGGSVVTLAKSCECRKPRPGLLLAAASELGLDLPGSWMIGDSTADVEAGARAGCRTILVEHAPSTHRRSAFDAPDARART